MYQPLLRLAPLTHLARPHAEHILGAVIMAIILAVWLAAVVVLDAPP